MSIDNPTVSVVMPVYNAEEYVREAIDSILQQTFSDIELLIINDGSTDRSLEIIRSCSDMRIRLINNITNIGLAKVRNQGIREAKGQYIAWLDADDKSHPDRLMKQVNFMNINHEIGLCGTWVKTIGPNRNDGWLYPNDPDVLKCRLLFDDPFATSSIMLRSSLLTQFNLSFSTEYPPAEDYDLWERLSHHCRFSNITEFLTYYRLHSSQTSIIKAVQQQKAVWKIQKRQIERLNILPFKNEKAIHQMLGLWKCDCSKEFIIATNEWLLKLYKSNWAMRVYSNAAFAQVLAERWFSTCTTSVDLGVWTLKSFWKSPLSQYINLSLKNKIKFAIKCLIKRRNLKNA